MRHIVNRLRRKPAHVRERMAIGATAVGSILLVFFWITIVRYEILPKDRLAQTRSPFETLGDIFKNTYQSTVANVASFSGEPEETGEGKLIVIPQEEIPSNDTVPSEESSEESVSESLEISE